ncbi:MAG: hypothetical protein U0414_33020 [Polyangiaceae bacterium]
MQSGEGGGDSGGNKPFASGTIPGSPPTDAVSGGGGSGQSYGPPPAQGYGPPPAQGYGPPPAQGYGPPPAQGYGPPPPLLGGYAVPPATSGYGAAPAATGGAPPVTEKPAKPPKAPRKPGAAKRVALFIAAGLAALLIGVGVYAAVWYYGSATPVLAKYMPKDTQAYFEVPSLTKAFVKLAGSDIIESSEVDTDKQLESTVDALSGSFDGLKKDDAETLVKAVNGVAVGMRNFAEIDQETVFLVSFSAAEPVEALLKSERFEKTDKIAGGQGYEIKSVERDSDKKSRAMERALDRITVKGKRGVAVWFEETKVLAIGSVDMVEDCGKVMRGDKDALATTEHFKQAKYENGGIALGWIDSDSFIDVIAKKDRDASDAKRKFFDGIGPFVVTARVADAGLVVTLTGDLRGKAMPDEKLVPKGGSMSLWEKLPDTTIAYLSGSNTKKLDPKERKELTLEFLKHLDRDAGRNADKVFDKLEDTLGISLDRIADAFGEQWVIGVVTTDKFKLDHDFKPTELFESVGVDALVKTNDHEAAEKLVKVIREKAFEDGPLGRKYDVDKKDDGFVASPKQDDLPLVRVILRDEDLLILVGQKKLIDKMIDAYEGDNTLKGDPAHKHALSAMSSRPCLFMWLDSGRVMRDALADADELKDELKDQGIPYKALKVEGDDRMTSAIALELQPDDGGVKYKLETLNAFGMSPFALLFRGFARKTAAKRADIVTSPPPPLPTPTTGDTGNEECDAYLDRIRRCPGALGESMRESLPQLVSTLKSGVSLNPTSMTSTCKQMNDTLKDSCP